MSKKILFLGLSDSVLADAQQQLARPDLEVFRGTSVEDVRSTLARTNIDHVFMGGGIPSQPHLPKQGERRKMSLVLWTLQGLMALLFLPGRAS